MKKYLLIFISVVLSSGIFAQSKSSGESRPSIIRIDNNWNRQENDNPQNPVITTPEGIIFSSNAEGLFIALPKSTNNVKLFALTGEVVWSGDLVQGRFFIPTRPGIYFLRINNKSYKVICK